MELKSIKEKMIVLRSLRKEQDYFKKCLEGEHARDVLEEDKLVYVYEDKIKDVNSLIDKLESELSESSENVAEVDEKRIQEALNKYFEIGSNCYNYELTRAKEAFSMGLMTADDFEEFTEDNTASIAAYIVNELKIEQIKK